MCFNPKNHKKGFLNMIYNNSINMIPEAIILGVSQIFEGAYMEGILPNEKRNIICESSDINIVRVDESGNIYAISPGIATITFKDLSTGKSASMKVQVIIGAYHLPVSNIRFFEQHIEMNVGDNYRMAVSIEPEDASFTSLSWYSSDKDVAVVNSNGDIVAIDIGLAKVFAYANDGSGQYCSCDVVVH